MVNLASTTERAEQIQTDTWVKASWDQFRNQELMGLLSICDLQSFSVLGNEAELDRQRVEVFQEYANGGLEIIGQKISGSVDYTDQILLMLKAEMDNQP